MAPRARAAAAAAEERDGPAPEAGGEGDATEAAATGALGGVVVGRVNVPKASDVLAGELRRRILTGELPERTMLPPERVLCEQTGLSRVTVREALRILEVQGLVVTRPGRSGGTVVTLPQPGEVSRQLSVFIQSRKVRLQALFETREAFEPALAAWAAERRTDADIAALEAANDRMAALLDDLPAYLDVNLEWHLLVARASHNELLSAFLEAISRAIHEGTSSPAFNSAEVRRIALRAHQRITEAIRDGDADAARRRMERHVHGFAEAMLEHPDHRDEVEVGEPVRKRAPRPRSRARRATT